MRLKNDVNLVDFLNQVQKCKYDVYMETVEEDKLNLKSVLSQYLFVVLVEQKDVWDHSRITCEEADREILADYLERLFQERKRPNGQGLSE